MSKVDDYRVYRLTEDTYADIKAVGSIGWVELPDGLRAVMVTDYAAIKQIGTHEHISRDGAQHWAGLRAGDVPPDSLVVPWVTNAGPLSAFGPEHRRLRKLMTPAFTKRRTDQLAPAIELIVAETLDKIATENPPDLQTKFSWMPVDLREHFCFPVPIATISALLGVDRDLFPLIRNGAAALFDTNLSREELTPLFMGLLGAIDELISRKRETPDDSLISSLIAANEDGDTYTAAEISEVVRITIVAGYETTVNLLDQAIYQLLRHPEHLRAVMAGEISWDNVIDEVLRHSSPANVVPMRFATKDITINGFPIPAGTPILVSFAGAGRDPNVHERADVFDPTRRPLVHLGFGTGVHRCPGAPLAMLEARIALPMLFERFTLSLVEDEIRPNKGIITNGHDRLLVTVTPND